MVDGCVTEEQAVNMHTRKLDEPAINDGDEDDEPATSCDRIGLAIMLWVGLFVAALWDRLTRLVRT